MGHLQKILSLKIFGGRGLRLSMDKCMYCFQQVVEYFQRKFRPVHVVWDASHEFDRVNHQFLFELRAR